LLLDVFITNYKSSLSLTTVKNFCFIGFFVMNSCITTAQNVNSSIQVSFQYGSHYKRIGASVGFWGLQNAVQINTNLQSYYHWQGIGPKGNFFETKASAALWLGFGGKFNTNMLSNFYNELQNNIASQIKIGYAYNAYWDTRGSSQNTGAIALEYQHIKVFSENDGFAFLPFDRFRTGSFHVVYEDSVQRIGLHTALWTGETKGAPTQQAKQTRYGIKNNSKLLYGNTSAGLLFASYARRLPQGMNGFVQCGIDHEKVRNFFQNKLIHDNKIVHALNPKNKNPHIPMIDENGNAITDATKQKIRKGKLFWSVGIGERMAF
jgi:hypothetical protein